MQLKHARDNNVSTKIYQGDIIVGNFEESMRGFMMLRDEYKYIKAAWEVYNKAILTPSKVVLKNESSGEQVGPVQEDGTF